MRLQSSLQRWRCGSKIRFVGSQMVGFRTRALQQDLNHEIPSFFRQIVANGRAFRVAGTARSSPVSRTLRAGAVNSENRGGMRSLALRAAPGEPGARRRLDRAADRLRARSTIRGSRWTNWRPPNGERTSMARIEATTVFARNSRSRTVARRRCALAMGSCAPTEAGTPKHSLGALGRSRACRRSPLRSR